MTSTSEAKRPQRQAIAWLALGGIICFFILQANALAKVAALGPGDFIAYWSAGRLNALGQNPYSPKHLLPLQQAEGWTEDWPNMMYYPPWTLPLVMPFGLLPFALSRLCWLVAGIAIILFSVDRIWRYYGGAAANRWLAWLFGLAFVPTLIAFKMGQIGPFLLLGVAGFLIAERRRLDWLAGAFLLLAAIKPQLLYLFGLAILVWAVDCRRWRVLAGGLAAGIVALLLASWPNPLVLGQYRFALSHPPSGNITPTLGALLRLAFGHEHVWLQYVPTVIGLLWFPFYYALNRRHWDWQAQAPVLLLASFLTASYGAWVFDLVVLLVPLLRACVWVSESCRRQFAAVAIASFVAADGVALAMNLGGAPYVLFIWMTPVLLIAYLWLSAYMRRNRAIARLGCIEQ